MKFLSVLFCACMLLDASIEVAADRTNNGGNLRTVETRANGNRNLAGKGMNGKGKTNHMDKMTSSKEGKGQGKGKRAGKSSSKSSKKSSKRMGKGSSKGDVSMSPSDIPSQVPSTYPSYMPTKTPVALSLDVSNDAISVDDGPMMSSDAISVDNGPMMSNDAISVDNGPMMSSDAISVDDGPMSNDAMSNDAMSIDDEDRAGTTSPGGSITIPSPPTDEPTTTPTVMTTKAPVVRLTKDPTRSPTADTPSPTIMETKAPVVRLTKDPTRSPTVDQSDRTGTVGPSLLPIPVGTAAPTKVPTTTPTGAPTETPETSEPTKKPSGPPTSSPIFDPTTVPTIPPPTGSPTTMTPTKSPTKAPTGTPTKAPIVTVPTRGPTTPRPTPSPTMAPTKTATMVPTSSPTLTDRTGGNDSSGGSVIPLLSILQGRIEPNSYFGGFEFEDTNSYQYKALQRIEQQEGAVSLSANELVQYYVLYCIYYSTNGAGWVTADGWSRNDLAPCGGFFGVSCDEDNTIVGINLYDNSLTGTFPPEITLLASDGFRSTGAGVLRSLDVYLNAGLGNGNDSHWVSELGSSLRYLFLGKTAFGGSIPQLPSGLIEFDASHTNIDGGLVAENFEGLNHLTWLLLDGCSFQTSIPTEFAELPKLEYFYISDAQITGDLSYLEGMPVLFEHFASNNPGLGGELYSFIGDITSLASLKLEGNSLEGSIPPSFGGLDNLQQLWLNDNNLSGQIPVELSELIALETLELQGNNMSGDFPDEICGMKDPGYSLTKLGADCSVHQCECCDCCTTDLCQEL